MKTLRRLLIVLAAIVYSIVIGLTVGSVTTLVYERYQYPGIVETDGLFDVGLVFLFATLGGILLGILTSIWFINRHNRK